MVDATVPPTKLSVVPGVEPDGAVAAEELLVTRARAGHEDAWARLYQVYFERIYRDVAYLVGAVAVAEEITQETFAVALTGLHNYKHQGRVLDWLRGIARNLVRRHWRTHVRRERAYERYGDIAPMALSQHREDPQAGHLQEQQARVLRDVLDETPEALREAFILCDVQGISAAEAGERLGISVGNVRVRASRARAHVRRELQRRGWLSEESVS